MLMIVVLFVLSYFEGRDTRELDGGFFRSRGIHTVIHVIGLSKACMS
jgi:hypothetical protein